MNPQNDQPAEPPMGGDPGMGNNPNPMPPADPGAGGGDKPWEPPKEGDVPPTDGGTPQDGGQA